MKKKTTTSKKLTWLVAIVWTISIAISFAAVFFNKDTVFILATVSGSFTIVLSGYFAKSFFETKESEKVRLLEDGTINNIEETF